MPGEIDNLEIEISASSESAEKKINALMESLNALKKARIPKSVTDSFKSFDDALKSLDSSRLESFTHSISALEGLGKIKISKTIATGISEIAHAVGEFSDESLGRLDRATEYLSRLSNVNLSGVRSALSGASAATQGQGAISSEAETVEAPGKDFMRAANAIASMGQQTRWGTDMENGAMGATRAIDILRGSLEKVSRIGAKAGSTLAKFGIAVGNAAKKAAQLTGSFFKWGWEKATTPIKNMTSRVNQFASSFKRILFYRMVRTVIKEIGEAFREGVGNLYQWSKAIGGEFAGNMDAAASSLLYFKNSIGAAVAPLLNALIPALNAIIDKVVQAINWINQLFAALSGASYWTRAKKVATEYQEAAAGAGAAAKEALRYLAPFDELNVLPSENAGGGGGGSALDYGDMFENVDFDESKFAWVDDLKKRLTGIFEVFKKAWDNEGQATIDSAKAAFNSLKDLLGAVGSSMEEVWTNGTGQETLETLLRIAQNLFGTVGAIADKLREAWEWNDSGTQIIQNIWDTFNNILHLVEDITASTKAWAQDLNFKPLMQSLATLTNGLKELSTVASGPLKTIWEKIFLPFAKFLLEQLIPRLVTLTGKFLSLAAAIGEKLNPIVDDAIKKYWEPFARFVEDTLISKIDKITSAIDFLTHAIKDDLEEEDELYRSTHLLHEVFEKFYTPLKDVFDIFGDLWTIFFDVNQLIFADLNPNVKMSDGSFSALKGTIDILLGPLDSLHKGLQFIKDILDKVAGAANRASEALSNAIRNKSQFESGTTTIGTSTSGGGRTFSGTLRTSASGTFATGGFPEDGLFFANHNELVGRFSNGKTAVANNEQIVAGIAEGVEDANEPVVTAVYAIGNQIVRAIQENGGSDVDWNALARQITKAQRQQNRALGTA